MSKNGESHDLGTCDNCKTVGKLGWVIGKPDGSHAHSCPNVACLLALEVVKPEVKKSRKK